MNTLITDIDRLRKNCPWYQMLTLETLRGYLDEEFQEVLGALDSNDPDSIKEELGDLLFQILLYSQVASERSWFSLEGILDGLHQKIIRRNQHVFGHLVLKDIDAINLHWQSIKASERNYDSKRKPCKMYDVKVNNLEAVVTFKHHPSVTIPLDPPPAEKFVPGYTQAAWIWLSLNETLDRASILLPDEDRKELAILISQQEG